MKKELTASSKPAKIRKEIDTRPQYASYLKMQSRINELELKMNDLKEDAAVPGANISFIESEKRTVYEELKEITQIKKALEEEFKALDQAKEALLIKAKELRLKKRAKKVQEQQLAKERKSYRKSMRLKSKAEKKLSTAQRITKRKQDLKDLAAQKKASAELRRADLKKAEERVRKQHGRPLESMQ